MKNSGLLIVLAISIFFNCTVQTSGQRPEETLTNESIEEEISDYTEEEKMDRLVAGNTQFALDIYSTIQEEMLANGSSENIFLSPYSISTAIAMAYAGSENDTAAQIKTTMHYNLPEDELHQTLNNLAEVLKNRSEGARGMDGGGFRLNVVNRLWAQIGYPFLTEYLTFIEENYKAPVEQLNFRVNPEGSRETINEWVSEQTEEKIPDLLPPRSIDTLTTLVITNAIYFNAAWSSPFNENTIHEAPFYNLDGSQSTVQMMSKVYNYPYIRGSNYNALSIPYDGNQLAMLIILPNEGEFQEVEESLTLEMLNTTIDNLRSTRVRLLLPKWKFRYNASLATLLQSMGMTDAFMDNADFSGMTGDRELHISDVIHEAFIDVNEAGTEAAAATAVIVSRTSIRERDIPINFTVDRPYLYAIYDIETRVILFFGRTVNL